MMETSNLEWEKSVERKFRAERVEVNFSSVALRTDRIYVSREQAARSMDSLQKLLDARKAL